MASFFSRLAVIALLTVISSPAATTITSYFLQYGGGVVNAEPNNVFDLTSSGYIVGGTLDVFVTDTGLPVTPGEPFEGPFALRFTNAFVSCTLSTCAPTTLNFLAFINFDNLAPDYGGTYGIEGTSLGNGSISIGIEGASSALQISNITLGGSFGASDSFPAGFLVSNGSNNFVLAMGLILPELAGGTALDLPDSLFQQVNAAAVPEPGTAAIVAAGLVGALWFRRRLS
jgi:hypothetical protein